MTSGFPLFSTNECTVNHIFVPWNLKRITYPNPNSPRSKKVVEVGALERTGGSRMMPVRTAQLKEETCDE